MTQEYSLKPDQEKYPIWIASDNHIFLEAFHDLYKVATDFLITIAEPVSRPIYIHEYKLTADSLCAAVSVNLTSDDIIKILSNLNKNSGIPKSTQAFIEENTQAYGKIKLVLKENGYSLESKWKNILEQTLDIISLPSKPAISVHEEEEAQFLYSADFEDDMCHIIKIMIKIFLC